MAPTVPEGVLSEAQQTDRVSKLGRQNGLFKQCMDEIKSSHSVGQALRSAALAAGALSDIHSYAELLSQFYVATEALEKRIDEILEKEEEMDLTCEDKSPSYKKFSALKQVKSLGYSFTGGYENDLEFLLGEKWRSKVNEMTTDPAKEYIQQIQCAHEINIIAAAFILWGPLVIGGEKKNFIFLFCICMADFAVFSDNLRIGGAALKPRVKKSFGERATNVFKDVVGTANGGRSERRRKFIDTYDGLLDGVIDNEKKKVQFDAIVKACGEYMSMNNAMMLSVKRSPWWSKYIWAGVATVFAMGASRMLNGSTMRD